VVLELSVSHSDDVANTGKDNLLMEEKLKSGLRSEFITAYLKGDADVLNSVEMKFEEMIRNQEFLFSSAPYFRLFGIKIRITC